MLVRPSVTPKDRNDYLAAYSKRHDPDISLLTDSTKSNVRFHPEARQIPSGNDYHGGEGDCEEDGRDDEAEDFPARRKPVKGRKQTGLAPARLVSKSDDCPPVAQIPRHHAAVSLDSSATQQEAIEPAAKPHKGLSLGMASKIAGAMRKSKSKRAADSSSHDEDISINVSTLSIRDKVEQSESVTKNSKKSTPHAMYAPEAFAPVFAEGISLYQPNATYNSKDKSELQKNMKSLPMSKHAFARIVDSARHHHHRSSNKKDAETNIETEAAIEIAPGPRARLLELAKTAKMKAQQKPNGISNDVESRDDEPGWNCAGMDSANLLQEARPLPSLTIQPATPQSLLDTERDIRKARERALKKSTSRSRLVEQARSEQPEEVIWIGRDGQEMTKGAEERQHRHHGHGHGHRHRSERSRSRHRIHQDSSHGTHYQPHQEDTEWDNDEHEHRRIHRSRHPEQHHVHPSNSRHDVHHSNSRHDTRQDMHHSRSTEQLPDKRKGKVLESGAETQRLNLALTMARTRMEMEIAEQQQGTKIERAVKDDEEKAWLEEAYEEAVKKEVEYQYLYEAHSLGGTW